MLSKELINYIMSHEDEDLVEKLLTGLLAESGEKNFFDFEAAKRLSIIIKGKIADGNTFFKNIATDLGRFESPLALFLEYYLVRTIYRDNDTALAKLNQTIAALPKADPGLLLERAKFLANEKQFEQAARDLKTALSLYPPYSFYISSERTLKKIIRSDVFLPRRKLKIALLSSSTTAFLTPVLKAIAFRDGIEADIYEGDYGNYRQEILNKESGLYKIAPDAVVIIPNYYDLHLDPDNYLETVDRAAEEIKNLWERLKEYCPCHIIQAGYNYPPDGAWGLLEDSLPGGRNRIINSINLKLSENLPGGVSYININKINRQLGKNFFSPREWHNAKQYPSTEALPLFSDYIAAHLRAVFGLSAKVLVVDLDNTLWGGIIGEDGLEKIIIGPSSAEGESYLELQRYIKDLDERGILLAVCSKNNLSDAKLPFLEHQSMLLKFDDFIMFTANWEDKASNIKNIAQSLTLGLDSFVFLDDNPLERELVRNKLPEVIVPECGNKPWEMLAALRRGMYFESVRLTIEDRARYEDYKQNLNRQQFEQAIKTKNSSNYLDVFLTGLGMMAECGEVDLKTLPRVTQLINKTNQFNLTTRRYSEEQVKRMSESPDWLTRWYRLKDRFGDYGLIGVILINKNETRWHVDTWLMSCRVLGRQVENFMFADLVESAKSGGAKIISAEYIKTPKNEMVRDLYSKLGFVYQEDSGYYIFDLETNPNPGCKFIKNLEGKTFL